MGSPPPLIPLIQNVPTVQLVKVQKSMVVYVLRQLLPHLLLQLPHLDLLLLLHLPLLLLLHLLEELLLATPPQLDLHLLSWLFLLLLDFKSTTTKNILCFFPIKFFSCKRNTNHITPSVKLYTIKKSKKKKNTTKTNSFICRSCCLFSFLVPSNPLSSFSLLIYK